MKKNLFVCDRFVLIAWKKHGLFKKSTSLFLMFFLIQFSVKTYSQNSSLDVKSENISVSELMEMIEKQSEFTFFYKDDEVNLKERVNIKAERKTVNQILDEVFSKIGLDYKISDKLIIVFPNKAHSNHHKQTQKRIISGSVSDSKGIPLPGVSVLVKGTVTGTSTDIEGNYTIEIGEEEHILLYSFVGMKSQEIDVTGKAVINVVLNEDVAGLEEVVVTALGIKRKTKALSYDVQEIKTEEITTVKNASFISSLSGKIAGVTINSSASGVGGGTKVVMRGAKSISQSNNALYVIDGVPIMNSNGGITKGVFSGQPKGEGISDFNPEDIESISVLSGPSAAALYGSNAANGAILITTKKGATGRVSITVANSTDFMTPFITPRFQNTYGNKLGEFSSWGPKLETPSSYDPLDFFQTGTNLTNSINLSVGNDKNQTYASIATTNANGIIPNNKYNRYNFFIRNTAKFLNNRMSLDVSAKYIVKNDQNMMAQGQYYNPLVSVYLFPRGENFDKVRLSERYDEGRKIFIQFWPYGDQGMQMQNPYWITSRTIFGTSKERYIMSSALKYNILDWLNISGRVRMDNAINEYEKKLYAGTAELFSGPRGYYAFSNSKDKQLYADALMSINKVFKNFSVTANVGGSFIDIKNDEEGYQGSLLKIPNFFTYHNIDFKATNTKPIQRGWHEQTQSVFGSVEFGLKSMLYLSFTGRNDWPSQLANSAEPSFFYPSVGLSAIVSEMVKMPKWVSYAKIRGSYSSVGSAPARYRTIPTFPYSEGQLSTNTFMPVPKLYAERTKSYEAGMNLKFFGNRANLNMTIYKSNTYKQTFKAEASPSSSYSSFYVQAGNVRNKGVEASLGVNNNFGGFKWSATATFSLNQNKIIELVNDYPDPITGKPLTIDELVVSGTGTYRMILKEGGQIGDIYTTTILREDNQGHVWVNPASNSLGSFNKLQKVGSANPKYNLGFRNDFTYKNFRIGCLVTARVGGVVVSATQAVLDNFGVSEASAIARDNGGVEVNNAKIDTRYYYSIVGGGQTGMLSHYVYSATNVRLHEVSLGYSFPKGWFNNKLALTLSLTGTNLFMFYNKAPFDPESIASTGTYYQGIDYFMQPSLKSVGFTMKIQF